MKENVLAKRYAKALFEIAKEEKNVEVYQKGLRDFCRVLFVQPDLLGLLCNREVSLQKRKAIVEWVGRRYLFSQSLLHFFFLVLDRERMPIFQDIVRVYEERVNELENVVIAKVTTADLATTKFFLEELSAVLGKITGKKVVCETEEDTTLIAGFQVRIEDTIYDGSVRAQLDSLKETLMS